MNFRKSIYIVLAFYFLSTNLFASNISVKFKNKNGLFQISSEIRVAVDASYVGWERKSKKWKWDGPKIFKVKNKTNIFQLDFRGQGVISNVKIANKKNSIKYTYEHRFSKSLEDTVGGGIEFNLDILSQKQNYGAKQPILLPNNRGWSWEFELGQTVEVVFPPKVAKIYFERGNKSKIRALFFSGKIVKGYGKISMEVNLPDKTLISPIKDTSSEHTQSRWLKNALNPTESFIDLSYLNDKPAGGHGFVGVVGSNLEFEDGTPARFFGTNVQAYSLFIQNKKLIKQHASRIAKLGFNLVRLHHHDSYWVNPSLISKGLTTQEINTKSLDSYFWWIKCLRDEGIYVWVDLQVQRPWRKGDLIPGWESDMEREAKKGMNTGKGFVYLNKRMQELTKKFNKELLTRVNPYTKIALKDDPSIMGVMITNENDLTFHFGNNFLKTRNHPYHQSLFDDEVEKFSNKFSLPENQLRKTWEPGASKYLLNDIEARFNKNMINHLRDMGVKVPITTTNFWGGKNVNLYSLPALTTGSMIDAHGYADNGVFNVGQLQKNPHYESNFLHWIGQGQVVGKPFTVSEYNVEQKSDFDNTYVPSVMVASMAAFQGWDAIMLFGYSNGNLLKSRATPWSSYTHPAILGVIPAMALLYRDAHVAPAKQTVVFSPVNNELFNKSLSPKTSIAIRTSLEQHRFVVAMPKIKFLPWLEPSAIGKNAIIINDFNKSMLPANESFITSDTGEIKRDWSKGIMTINTKKTQLVMGKIGGRKIKLDDIEVNAKTPEAVIIFTSLDNQSIRISKRILVSAVAKVAKVKHKWKSSYISEPVKAKITFSSIHKGLRLVALRSDGSEGRSLPVKKNSNGDYSFILSEKDKTHWYIITL
ncbi:MAG: glycosyl hydrolase family 5 [Pseudomonadota bacterium]